MSLIWKIVIGIFVIAYLYSKFMEGYNKLDAPEQLRKQTKQQAKILSNQETAKNSGTSPVEELMKYRALLDEKLISQEDYDTKKNEILKL